MKVKVGDITKIKTGKLDANASSTDGKYPFFTCSKEPLKIDTYSYDCECVLVAGNGDLNVKYYNGKFDAYQRTYIIEDDSNGLLYMPYLYCFLERYIEVLRKQSIGGVIKYIKLGNLTEALIELPSIEEQKYIVSLMNISSELISLRKNIIDKLDTLIKARFIEMFENDNYPIEKLGEICEKITDGTHKTPTYLEEGITFISAKNIVNGELDFTDIKYISEEAYQEIQKRCQTSLYDILLSKSGSLGYPVIVKTKEKLGLFESLAVLKYDREKILPEFLCEQLKTNRIQRQFYTGTKGVAIKHLHLGVIANTGVIVPPLDSQKTFADFVQQVDKSRFIELLQDHGVFDLGLNTDEMDTYYHEFLEQVQDQKQEVIDNQEIILTLQDTSLLNVFHEKTSEEIQNELEKEISEMFNGIEDEDASKLYDSLHNQIQYA